MTGALVVVAHESETIGDMVMRLCRDAGYAAHAVRDGREVLSLLEHRPAALILDVALAEVLAHEVVEQYKRRSATTRILLLASIYNRTSYKRRPTSLYGADDYVEQHHIPDVLLPKLERLIGPPPHRNGVGSEPASHADQADHAQRKAMIARASERRLSAVRPGMSRSELIQRAERLAHLIVADIAFYNSGIFEDQPSEELEARLRLDVEEGRLLFDLRIPKEIRDLQDFMGEALIALRKARGGQTG